MAAPHSLMTGGLSERQHIVLNAVVFQIAWLVCVWFGSLVAVMTTVGVVALHLTLVNNARAELQYIGKVLAIGFACDWLFVQTGVLATGGVLPPPWLTCLWVLFATTVGYPMRLFHHRMVLSALGGGLFAPLSYYGGAKLAGVALMQPDWLGLLIIGLSWALIFPLVIHLYTQAIRPAGVES
jgi:hypothetical protein